MNSDLAIQLENVTKEYRLGVIGGGTLRGDLQSWWALRRGREDPNSRLGGPAPAGREPFLALDNVSLEVRKGETLGIIGGNGAGKSTLLKLLSRVTAPTEGVIRLEGRVSSMLEVGTGFHRELTGRENIYMNGAILGMSRREVDAKMDSIIAFSECEKFIDTPVKRYSSGMYVRLAFAVAAHLDSDIMLMDEVLAVGDMKFQQKCLGRMNAAASEEQKTVLYVSHNMNTIRQICSRCILLERGRIVFDGDVDRAISLYLENAMQPKVSGTFAPEDHNLNATGTVRLLGFTLPCTESGCYDGGVPLKLRLDYSCGEVPEPQFLRIVVDGDDGNPVGAAFSETPMTFRKTDCGSLSAELDLSALAPGSYRLRFALFSRNEFGACRYSDVIKNGVALRLEDKENRVGVWKSRFWGNTRLPLQAYNHETGG